VKEAKVDLGIWSKLMQLAIALVAIAGLLLIIAAYLPQIQENQRMRAEIYKLEAQIQEQEDTAKKLQAEIDALRNDPKTVERLAREKLGYARADETVVRFETNAPVSP
jgi:cell division protein FtsB